MAENVVILDDKCGPKRAAGDQFVVNLDWKFAADLDLAALCLATDGGHPTLVAHENLGKRAQFPFTHIAHQSEGSGRTKQRREHLVITDATAHQAIFLFVWDVDAIRLKQPAAFASNPGSYRLYLLDRTNRQYTISPSADDASNCLLLAIVRRAGEIEHKQIGMCLASTEGIVERLLEVIDAEGVGYAA